MRSSARQYVVNADDFGMSSSVNEAIRQAFDEGLISSTSIMTNMSGFAHACEIARACNLNGRIGVHLNLTQGAPLTEDICYARRFVDTKEFFSFGLPRSAVVLTRQELIAVRREWEAQIRRCVDKKISPTHLDSHHHVHTVWPLLSVTIDLARTFGIPFVRISRNVGPRPGAMKSLYKAAMNWRLRRAGLAASSYFGSAADSIPVHHQLSGRIEIMVHPRLEGNLLVDDLFSEQGNPQLVDAIGNFGIAGKMLSYSEVAKRKAR
jgi:chitin disaccharide deacetylase